MRTILKRNLFWILMPSLIILSCCKKNPQINETIEASNLQQDTVKLKIEKNFFQINSARILAEIPDSLAMEYTKTYSNNFPEEEKFPRLFAIDKKTYNKILNDKNPNDNIKFLLTENNGVLDILYENGDGKKFNFNLGEYNIVSNSSFTNMDGKFKGNLYTIMNNRINVLDSNIHENTREVIIPISSFKNLGISNDLSMILLFPGIITKDSSPRTGMANQKNYITLIAVRITFDSSGINYRIEKTVLYDNFCVSPPNNC